MILSFGWTTPAVLAEVKTVTRREWAPSHARKFRPGMKVDAWNTTPRNVRHDPRPQKFATIEIESVEWSNLYPVDDWVREGFDYLQAHGHTVDNCEPLAVWRAWLTFKQSMWVVRFRVEDIVLPCLYCGEGRAAGHELVGAPPWAQWQAGEDWSAHVYEPVWE